MSAQETNPSNRFWLANPEAEPPLKRINPFSLAELQTESQKLTLQKLQFNLQSSRF